VTAREYDGMIEDGMRAMTRLQHVMHEIEMTERQKRNRHTVEYDPLPYNYNGYDPLPVDLSGFGQDNWGHELPRPSSPSPVGAWARLVSPITSRLRLTIATITCRNWLR
jgi:hypothetical protein